MEFALGKDWVCINFASKSLYHLSVKLLFTLLIDMATASAEFETLLCQLKSVKNKSPERQDRHRPLKTIH